MRWFGAIVFGLLAVASALAALWLAFGAGARGTAPVVFGLAVSPLLFGVLAGPAVLLFIASLIRARRP